MKKVLFFVTLSIIFFTSCEKEGIENNDHKVFGQEEIVKRSESGCNPSSGFPEIWISNVLYKDYVGSGEDFEYASGASTYSDYTSECINVDPNSSHHVLFVEGSEIPFYCSIWIDYGNNGQFNDPSEQILNNHIASGSGSPTSLAGLPIPPGNSTLRIIVSAHPIGGPCDDIDIGEIEDYSICVPECLCTAESMEILSLGLSNEGPSGQECTYEILMSTIAECDPEMISSSFIEFMIGNDTIEGSLYNFNGAGTYTITGTYSITDINGCTASISKSIVVTLDNKCNIIDQYELCDIDAPTNLNTNCENNLYTWDAVSGGNGDYEVQFNINVYKFCCNGGATEPQVVTVLVSGNELSFDEASLPSFKNGTWQVRAKCAGGLYSEWSDVVPILLCINPGGGFMDD